MRGSDTRVIDNGNLVRLTVHNERGHDSRKKKRDCRCCRMLKRSSPFSLRFHEVVRKYVLTGRSCGFLSLLQMSTLSCDPKLWGTHCLEETPEDYSDLNHDSASKRLCYVRTASLIFQHALRLAASRIEALQRIALRESWGFHL